MYREIIGNGEPTGIFIDEKGNLYGNTETIIEVQEREFDEKCISKGYAFGASW